jgi:hypothetical protein
MLVRREARNYAPGDSRVKATEHGERGHVRAERLGRRAGNALPEPLMRPGVVEEFHLLA